MEQPNKTNDLTQPSDESSFGHKLGENRGQQGSPLGGTLSVDHPDADSRDSGQGRLKPDQDNAIEGQRRARHNSGSHSGQR